MSTSHGIGKRFRLRPRRFDPGEAQSNFRDPQAPYKSSYVERVIGSIRRECLDNVVVLHQRHLHRILTAYFDHYHRWRCH